MVVPPKINKQQDGKAKFYYHLYGVTCCLYFSSSLCPPWLGGCTCSLPSFYCHQPYLLSEAGTVTRRKLKKKTPTPNPKGVYPVKFQRDGGSHELLQPSGEVLKMTHHCWVTCCLETCQQWWQWMAAVMHVIPSTRNFTGWTQKDLWMEPGSRTKAAGTKWVRLIQQGGQAARDSKKCSKI